MFHVCNTHGVSGGVCPQFLWGLRLNFYGGLRRAFGPVRHSLGGLYPRACALLGSGSFGICLERVLCGFARDEVGALDIGVLVSGVHGLDAGGCRAMGLWLESMCAHRMGGARMGGARMAVGGWWVGVWLVPERVWVVG